MTARISSRRRRGCSSRRGRRWWGRETHAEALELVDTEAPDLALVDVELGDEDGVALAHELVARRPSTRAILISAHELGDLEFSSGDAHLEFLSKASLASPAIEDVLARS